MWCDMDQRFFSATLNGIFMGVCLPKRAKQRQGHNWEIPVGRHKESENNIIRENVFDLPGGRVEYCCRDAGLHVTGDCQTGSCSLNLSAGPVSAGATLFTSPTANVRWFSVYFEKFLLHISFCENDFCKWKIERIWALQNLLWNFFGFLNLKNLIGALEILGFPKHHVPKVRSRWCEECSRKEQDLAGEDVFQVVRVQIWKGAVHSGKAVYLAIAQGSCVGEIHWSVGKLRLENVSSFQSVSPFPSSEARRDNRRTLIPLATEHPSSRVEFVVLYM